MQARNSMEQTVRIKVIINLKEQPDFAKFKKERIDDAIEHFRNFGIYDLNPALQPTAGHCR